MDNHDNKLYKMKMHWDYTLHSMAMNIENRKYTMTTMCCNNNDNRKSYNELEIRFKRIWRWNPAKLFKPDTEEKLLTSLTQTLCEVFCHSSIMESKCPDRQFQQLHVQDSCQDIYTEHNFEGQLSARLQSSLGDCIGRLLSIFRLFTGRLLSAM